MIWEVMYFITQQLNSVLKLKFGFSEETAILSSVVNSDGSPAVQDDNKVIVSVVKIEPEKMKGADSGSGLMVQAPTLYLNLHVMFSVVTKPGNYAEGLKLLSGVISYFQSKNIFTPQDSPGLSNRIEKLHFELQKLEFMEQSNLWSSLGGKYLPSAVYKVRTLPFTTDTYSGAWPAISGLEGDNEIKKRES